MDLFARFGVINDRSDRDFQQNIFALAPGFVRPFAVSSAFTLVLGIEAEVDQRVMALAGFHDNVAALAAISAGRASARNKLLAAEGDATIAAVAGFYSNCGFVNEHRRSLVVGSRANPENAETAALGCSPSGNSALVVL